MHIREELGLPTIQLHTGTSETTDSIINKREHQKREPASHIVLTDIPLTLLKL